MIKYIVDFVVSSQAVQHSFWGRKHAHSWDKDEQTGFSIFLSYIWNTWRFWHLQSCGLWLWICFLNNMMHVQTREMSDLCSKNDWYQLCILTQVSLTPVQALLMCTTKFSALRIVLSSFAVHINGWVSFVLACSMGGATMAVWATAGRWRRATQWKCPSTCCRPRPAAAPTGSGRRSTWLVGGGTPWQLRSGQRPPTDHGTECLTSWILICVQIWGWEAYYTIQL